MHLWPYHHAPMTLSGILAGTVPKRVLLVGKRLNIDDASIPLFLYISLYPSFPLSLNISLTPAYIPYLYTSLSLSLHRLVQSNPGCSGPPGL